MDNDDGGGGGGGDDGDDDMGHDDERRRCRRLESFNRFSTRRPTASGVTDAARKKSQQQYFCIRGEYPKSVLNGKRDPGALGRRAPMAPMYRRILLSGGAVFFVKLSECTGKKWNGRGMTKGSGQSLIPSASCAVL
jgi:hypothetical protein